RVSLNDLQLLQRLVFIESEKFEREQEKNERVCEASLLKFFVKHLVRISLKCNSFYVALGISRILHNYGTADAMEIYNIVVQDPDRVHDDYYYRSRKGVLMKELKLRFGEMLATVKGNRGEERFCSRTDAEDLPEIARECLQFFTPWNSVCAVPEKFNPFDDVIKPFYFDQDDPDAEHRIEVNRIHAALHPSCFARLTNALKLPAPAEKMEIPKFMLTSNQTNFSDDDDWRNPPNLEADELQTIKDALAAEAAGRKAMTAGFLRVVADGDERAQINLAATDSAKFNLDGSAELIEIYGDDEILLATHLLSYDKVPNGKQSQTIRLEGGQQITFDFAPTLDEFGEVSEINFAVNYAETVWHRRFALALRRTKFALVNSFNQPILKPALTFGLLLLALTFGWLVFRNGEQKDEFVNAPTPPNQNSEANIFQVLPPEEKREAAENRSAPKDLKEKNNAAPKQPEKPETVFEPTPNREIKNNAAPQREIAIEIPRRELANNNNKIRQNETDENGVLRLPVREDNRSFPNEKIATRGKNKLRGKSLSEIKGIYLEISGDQILGNRIATQIAAELEKSGRFSITSDKEQAEAALKIYIRHESDGDSREEASVAAIVRLVNAEGFVIYPNRQRISGWKYVGTMAKLPTRIASDLAKSKR
ncbi:MAG: hypothetical protein LH472_07065, partial [Pyrinomonadaceae bacterium]|nr:hypothetical protein [Pyrinomonadaceae bacterium]